MRFSDKLERLTANVNKAKASLDAGLPPTAISNYLAKGQVPRADTGVAIARVLGVAADWLFDDAQDWPPPKAEPAVAASLSDGDLMEEVARRRRLVMSDLLKSIERIEKVDWGAVRKRLGVVPIGAPLPDELLADVAPAAEARRQWHLATQRFDLKFYDMLYGKMSPVGRKPEELNVERLAARHLSAINTADFRHVKEDVKRRPNGLEIDMPTWGDVEPVLRPKPPKKQ